jgi:hypothetical protein
MSKSLQAVFLFPSLRSIIAALFLFLGLSSCAAPFSSYSNHYFPVINREQRASSLGFSIAPPTGVDWYEKKNNNSLYYLKKINTDNYAIYTKATEIHLGNSELESNRFLQYVKNDKKLNVTAGDYRNISFRYTLDTALSPLCIRYAQDYEDHSSKNLKKDEFVRVKKHGLVCMHPDTPENGIDMFYVESFKQSQTAEDQSYKDEGEVFLSSLKFHSGGETHRTKRL